jgi:CheY-like chemotaxis protein
VSGSAGQRLQPIARIPTRMADNKTFSVTSHAPLGGSGGAHSIPASTVTVLHIDDDPNDTALLQAAARKASADFQLQNVEDGEQAMAYLGGANEYADRRLYPLPSLVLLDLKMPKSTGFEVLDWIRKHPELGKIPVVVLSGSELKDDMDQAMSQGANSYMVKPIGFDALVTFVRDLGTQWLPDLR